MPAGDNRAAGDQGAGPAPWRPPPGPAGRGYRFHAMVKPVGSLCNLDCTYCYYLHKQELLGHPDAPRMADDLLEQHIRQYLEAQSGDEAVFSWQGGEPTLLGLDFFRRAVALEARYRRPGLRIENDLQTNGILLDPNWARFLKDHRFLVGLSIDGPPKLHDRYRVTKGGQPTHARVMAAVRLLQKHEVPFNVLCVVNRENARFPLDVYRFLTRAVGTRRVQFIPGVEPRVFRQAPPPYQDPAAAPIVGSAGARPGSPESVVTDWSVDPDDWGRFLAKVWDDWYARDYGKVHVDIFEGVVAQALGYPAQRCVTAEFCGKALAIEHDGDVFSCDHYVYPEYRLGNIRTTHWGELAYAEPQQQFGFAKRDALPPYCRECEFLSWCWGECPKNRLVRTPAGDPGLNYLCPGLKRFFAHVQRDLPEILRRVRAEQGRPPA